MRSLRAKAARASGPEDDGQLGRSSRPGLTEELGCSKEHQCWPQEHSKLFFTETKGPEQWQNPHWKERKTESHINKEVLQIHRPQSQPYNQPTHHFPE